MCKVINYKFYVCELIGTKLGEIAIRYLILQKFLINRSKSEMIQLRLYFGILILYVLFLNWTRNITRLQLTFLSYKSEERKFGICCPKINMLRLFRFLKRAREYNKHSVAFLRTTTRAGERTRRRPNHSTWIVTELTF